MLIHFQTGQRRRERKKPPRIHEEKPAGNTDEPERQHDPPYHRSSSVKISFIHRAKTLERQIRFKPVMNNDEQ